MQIQSPIKNGLLRVGTYATIALAFAARDPNLAYYLISSGVSGAKSAARTSYNNAKVLKQSDDRQNVAVA